MYYQEWMDKSYSYNIVRIYCKNILKYIYFYIYTKYTWQYIIPLCFCGEETVFKTKVQRKTVGVCHAYLGHTGKQ